MAKLNNQLATLFAFREQVRQSILDEANQIDLNSQPVIQASPRNACFIEGVQNYLSEHYGSEQATPTLMAEALNTSTKTLTRKTKALLANTPQELIRSYRLAKAKSMLEKGSSASDVTFACGFSSASHFSKCFKQEFGLRPTDIKQKDRI